MPATECWPIDDFTAEADFMAYQVAAMAGLADGWVLNGISSEDADETVARFVQRYGELRDQGRREVTKPEFFELRVLYQSVSGETQEYADDVAWVADVAAGVAAGIASAVVISLSGGTATPGVLALAGGWGGMAGATARVVAAGAPVSDDTVKAFGAGAIDGVLGGLGGKLAAAVVSRAAPTLAGSLARLVPEAVAKAGAGRLSGLAGSAVDGALGSVGGMAFGTAWDGTLWDMTLDQVITSFLGAGLFGGAMGAGVGTIMEALMSGTGALWTRLSAAVGPDAARGALRLVTAAGYEAEPPRWLSEASAAQLVDLNDIDRLSAAGRVDEADELLSRFAGEIPDMALQRMAKVLALRGGLQSGALDRLVMALPVQLGQVVHTLKVRFAEATGYVYQLCSDCGPLLETLTLALDNPAVKDNAELVARVRSLHKLVSENQAGLNRPLDADGNHQILDAATEIAPPTDQIQREVNALGREYPEIECLGTLTGIAKYEQSVNFVDIEKLLDKPPPSTPPPGYRYNLDADGKPVRIYRERADDALFAKLSIDGDGNLALGSWNGNYAVNIEGKWEDIYKEILNGTQTRAFSENCDDKWVALAAAAVQIELVGQTGTWDVGALRRLYRSELLSLVLDDIGADQAKYATFVDGLDPLNRGWVAEKWYSRNVAKAKPGETSKRLSKEHNPTMDSDRVFDVVQGMTATEIKAISGEMSSHDKAQLLDYLRAIKTGAKLGADGESGTVTELVYVFTDSNALKAPGTKKMMLKGFKDLGADFKIETWIDGKRTFIETIEELETLVP